MFTQIIFSNAQGSDNAEIMQKVATLKNFEENFHSGVLF